MTSILTNISAMAALQTLRGINSSMSETQAQVSSGLRVQTAADNAAYWSISTTMRSDNKAISAVADALGLGAAKADTAYSAMSAVIDTLSEFKAKLVAAKELGVDKGKIQKELDQLKEQVVGIATSASFGGQNWLNTDISSLQDDVANKVSLVSSFTRSSTGGVSVNTIDFHLSEVSLFNSTGGGLLEADPRDVGTLAGMRHFSGYQNASTSPTLYFSETGKGWMHPNHGGGSTGVFSFSFPDGSPLDFNTPGAEIAFDLVLDKEASNPDNRPGVYGELEYLPGPYDPGYSTSISITKADVDAYNPALGGIISTNTDFAGVLNMKLQPEGAYVVANYGMWDPLGSGSVVHDPVLMSIWTKEDHGDGSYVEIANLSSTGVSTGGLVEDFDFGNRGSGMVLDFEPFALEIDGDHPDGVEVTFDFSMNGAAPTSHMFNRASVNQLLGKTTGAIETPAEMVTLLHSLLDADWPDLIIDVSASDPDKIIVKSDPDIDREWGSQTHMNFSNIVVNIEPIPILSFLGVDIEQNPNMIDSYIDYMELASSRVVDGAALLGTLQSRIEMQSEFTAKITASIERGIGRLVDADMNEASTRLKAMQTQEQLAIQALSIANSNSDNVTQLFR